MAKVTQLDVSRPKVLARTLNDLYEKINFLEDQLKAKPKAKPRKEAKNETL